MAQGSVGTAYLTLVPKMDNGAMSSAESAVRSSGTKAGDGFSLNFGNALKTIAGLAAVQQAASAVADTFMSAFNGYAQYEQLVGGVETLFKDSADVVERYAKNAYETAGLSANEYMDTVTSFSASLLQSLDGDTASAAQYANTAITDMSDNANKMGTSMESIQNAYQGFAKQNYTMLDNLKLGYGGTKSEMERLISDANELRKAQGLNADLTIDSYADIVTAIHEVQTEMGITGTTALEASTTIEGSVNSVKSAWDNLLTSLGTGDAEWVQENIDSLIDSIFKAVPNIFNAVKNIFSSVGDKLIEYAPTIGENMPKLVGDLVMFLLDNIPVIIDGAFQFMAGFARGIADSTPAIVDALGSIVARIGEIVMEIPGKALQWGADIIDSLATGIRNAIGGIADAASDIAGTIASFLHFSEPDVGPLSNFHTFMPDMIDMMVDGMGEGERRLENAAYGVAGTLRDGLSSGGYATGGGAVYVNNAVVNDDARIRELFIEFMDEANRKGAM